MRRNCPARWTSDRIGCRACELSSLPGSSSWVAWRRPPLDRRPPHRDHLRPIGLRHPIGLRRRIHRRRWVAAPREPPARNQTTARRRSARARAVARMRRVPARRRCADARAIAASTAAAMASRSRRRGAAPVAGSRHARRAHRTERLRLGEDDHLVGRAELDLRALARIDRDPKARRLIVGLRGKPVPDRDLVAA